MSLRFFISRDYSVWLYKAGNPNTGGIIECPAYNKEDDKYIYVAGPPLIRTGFSKIKPPIPAQAEQGGG